MSVWEKPTESYLRALRDAIHKVVAIQRATPWDESSPPPSRHRLRSIDLHPIFSHSRPCCNKIYRSVPFGPRFCIATGSLSASSRVSLGLRLPELLIFRPFLVHTSTALGTIFLLSCNRVQLEMDFCAADWPVATPRAPAEDSSLDSSFDEAQTWQVNASLISESKAGLSLKGRCSLRNFCALSA